MGDEWSWLNIVRLSLVMKKYNDEMMYMCCWYGSCVLYPIVLGQWCHKHFSIHPWNFDTLQMEIWCHWLYVTTVVSHMQKNMFISYACEGSLSFVADSLLNKEFMYFSLMYLLEWEIAYKMFLTLQNFISHNLQCLLSL